jgi:hypothetical protein
MNAKYSTHKVCILDATVDSTAILGIMSMTDASITHEHVGVDPPRNTRPSGDN